MKEISNNMDLQQQLVKFESENPKIAEALELFEVSFEKYQNAIRAMSVPRIYTGSSTIFEDRR